MDKIIRTKILNKDITEINIREILNKIPATIPTILHTNSNGIWLESNPVNEDIYNLCVATLGDLVDLDTTPNIQYGKTISPVGLNIREQATTDSNIVGVLDNGQRFHIVQDLGQWYQIDKPCNGYIYKEYTSTSSTPNQISPQLLAFTKSWEGFSSQPYLDAGGNWTVGYGNCTYDVKPAPVTQAEASQNLENTLNSLAEQVYNLTKEYNLCQSEFDSLVDFSYNLGFGALEGSDLLQNFIECMNDSIIVGDFTAWSYCNGEKLEGLVRRRIAESNMWLYGQYDNN